MNAMLLWSLFDSDDPLPVLGPVSPVVRERLILLGVILLVVAAAFVGLLVRRQLRHRRSRRQRRGHRRGALQRAAAGVAELRQMIPNKPRRRHREHRPRNPTLAETGGLPPVRSNPPLDPPQSDAGTP